jgi:hypothetical protein
MVDSAREELVRLMVEWRRLRIRTEQIEKRTAELADYIASVDAQQHLQRRFIDKETGKTWIYDDEGWREYTLEDVAEEAWRQRGS